MSVATVVLERARPGDVDAIRALPGLSGSTGRLLDRELDRHDRRCLLARTAEGEVVGYGAVLVAAGDAHLLDVVVAPGWRRQGLGTRLVERVRDLARDDLGARALTLEVRAGNHAARALYRRLGLVEAGVRPGYYPDGGPDGGREDAVLLWDHDLAVPPTVARS